MSKVKKSLVAKKKVRKMFRSYWIEMTCDDCQAYISCKRHGYRMRYVDTKTLVKKEI